MKMLGRKLVGKLVFLFVLLSTFSLFGYSQSPEIKSTPETQETPSVRRTTADETFELNISERRFTREDFEASTSVGTDPDSRLNLQIGVALAAGRIDVILRNVRGNVRFHGTVERILEMINNRRAPSVAPSPK